MEIPPFRRERKLLRGSSAEDLLDTTNGPSERGLPDPTRSKSVPWDLTDEMPLGGNTSG